MSILVSYYFLVHGINYKLITEDFDRNKLFFGKSNMPNVFLSNLYDFDNVHFYSTSALLGMKNNCVS